MTGHINELPKMDTGMLNKADEFLKDEKTISTRTGLRFIIEMMGEEFRALNAVVENQNTIIRTLNEQSRRIDELEKKNIIMFIERNPKLAFLFSVGLIIVSNIFPISYLRKILFLKLGIPDPFLP